MRQVQRCKFGIDRRGDDYIGKSHVRIFKPGPLFPEKDAALEPRLMTLEQGRRRAIRRKHRLRQKTAPGGGCGDIIEIRDGGGD